MRFVGTTVLTAVFFALGVGAVIGLPYLRGATAKLFGDPISVAPPTLRQVVFRADCFGRIQLAGCADGLGVENLTVENTRAEFVHHRDKSSRYRVASLAVGRLDVLIVKADGTQAFVPCTGTLIADKYVLTASHCRNDPDSRRTIAKVVAAQFVLGFTQGNSRALALKVSLEPADSCATGPGHDPCRALDYVIFELAAGEAERAKAEGFTSVRPSAREIQPGQDLFIIHHPADRAQMLSTHTCFVTSRSEDRETFLDSCWTSGGSSGAPIFDDATGEVVGMHVRSVTGRTASDRQGVGIPISMLRRSSIINAAIAPTAPSER